MHKMTQDHSQGRGFWIQLLHPLTIINLEKISVSIQTQVYTGC